MSEGDDKAGVVIGRVPVGDGKHLVTVSLGRFDLTSPEPAMDGPPMHHMPAVVEAMGFDPTNHHNAAKCPYCTPRVPTLRERREAMGLSLGDVVWRSKCKLSKPHLVMIETGVRSWPRLQTIEHLARAYDVPMRDIVASLLAGIGE